jgi:hypothetical protein
MFYHWNNRLKQEPTHDHNFMSIVKKIKCESYFNSEDMDEHVWQSVKGHMELWQYKIFLGNGVERRNLRLNIIETKSHQQCLKLIALNTN